MSTLSFNVIGSLQVQCPQKGASRGSEMEITQRHPYRRLLEALLWQSGVISAPFMVQVSSLSNSTEKDKAGGEGIGWVGVNGSEGHGEKSQPLPSLFAPALVRG